MLKTPAEIRQIAERIVNNVVVDVQEEFPSIKTAVSRTNLERWQQNLVNMYDTVDEILLNAFGSTR